MLFMLLVSNWMHGQKQCEQIAPPVTRTNTNGDEALLIWDNPPLHM